MERMGSFLRFLRGRARWGTQIPPFSLGRRPYTGSRSILGSASVICRPEIAEALVRGAAAGRDVARGAGMKPSTEAVATKASAATLDTQAGERFVTFLPHALCHPSRYHAPARYAHFRMLLSDG